MESVPEHGMEVQDIYMQDTFTLLENLPMEIWLKILDNVDDLNVVLNWVDSSTFFSDLLKNKKDTYVMFQVLNILVQKSYIEPSDSRNLLNCRLINKCWKEAVDHFYKTAPLEVNLRFDKYHQTTILDMLYGGGLHLYQWNFHKLLENTEESNNLLKHCPPPSRYIEISMRIGEKSTSCYSCKKDILKTFHTDTKQFLHQIGRHLLYAQINLGSNISIIKWYEEISAYVTLMPNLKYLELTGPATLVNSQNTSPLPPFPTLRHLEMLRMANVPSYEMNAVLTSNKNVKCFTIPISYYGRTEEHSEILDVTCLHNPHTISIPVPFPEYLGRIPEQWNLRTVCLDFKKCSEFVDWAIVFSKLECYQDTLSEIYLRMPIANSQVEMANIIELTSSQYCLNLPNLKTCQLVLRNICSFEFLSGLKSLTELRLILIGVDYSLLTSTTYMEATDYYNLLTEKYRCMSKNLFKQIPSLEVVSIRYDCGLVHEYRHGRQI